MLIVGLVIVVVGVVLIVGGLFGADVSAGQVEFLGIDVSPTALFLLGVVGGVCVLLGLSVTKFGAKRGLKQRKEHKRIDELSHKLDRAEANRRGNPDDE